MILSGYKNILEIMQLMQRKHGFIIGTVPVDGLVLLGA